MDNLPDISLQSQNIEPLRLPINSYRFRAAQYGRFQPFDLVNDSDVWGNNQLNWISLYLLKTFGFNKSNEQNKEQTKDKILEMLNNQIKELKEQITLIEKLDNIEQINQILEKENTIEKRLQRIEKAIEQLNKQLNPLEITSKTTSEISRSLT